MATKKCPVCDWVIEDDAKTIEFDGKTITVCCDECAAKFQDNPEQYMKPR